MYSIYCEEVYSSWCDIYISADIDRDDSIPDTVYIWHKFPRFEEPNVWTLLLILCYRVDCINPIDNKVGNRALIKCPFQQSFLLKPVAYFEVLSFPKCSLCFLIRFWVSYDGEWVNGPDIYRPYYLIILFTNKIKWNLRTKIIYCMQKRHGLYLEQKMSKQIGALYSEQFSIKYRTGDVQ